LKIGTQLSLRRKLVELWWAFQMEKNLTKYEILEQYLNRMPFGHGNYGIEAASQYFFNHSASELSLAESAMLAIQLVKPNLYSPIRRPKSAKRIPGDHSWPRWSAKAGWISMPPGKPSSITGMTTTGAGTVLRPCGSTGKTGLLTSLNTSGPFWITPSLELLTSIGMATLSTPLWI
jgi:hypothetical protein